MRFLRSTSAGVLSLTASVLSLTSKVLDTAAETLRPPSKDGDRATPPASDPAPAPSPLRAAADAPDDEFSGDGVMGADDLAVDQPTAPSVGEPTPSSVEFGPPPHVRTSESHLQELAARPAAEVIAAVGDLSTDELRLLTDYEMAGRNRKTVLQAIERAVAPA